MSQPGPRNLITDVPGIKVGNAEDQAVRTGVTVVLPDADLKVYLTASPENRAQRRWLEMRNRGQVVGLETVLSETLARDDIDSNRDDSPLKPAKDAWQLNTDRLDIEQVVQKIIARSKGR